MKAGHTVQTAQDAKRQLKLELTNSDGEVL